MRAAAGRDGSNVSDMTVIVGIGPVSFDDVVAVARGGAAVAVAEEAVAAIDESRTHIEALAAESHPGLRRVHRVRRAGHPAYSAGDA